MRRGALRQTALFTLIIVGLLVNNVIGQEDSSDTLIGQAFTALDEAVKEGGDVSLLVEELHQLIHAVDNGEITYSDLSVEINRVITEANQIEREAVSIGNTDLIFRVIVGFSSIVLSYITWKYLPVYFWRYWLRLRGDWRIQR